MATAASDVRSTQAIDVWELEQYLGVAVRDLDPDAVATRDAERMWSSFMGLARFALAGAALMARRVDDSGAWKRTQARSAAEHLANVAGTSEFEARQMLQTSSRVQKLPATAAAMLSGALSPGKAYAIADAASVVPDEEARLLEGAARKSFSDVREECLQAKAKSNPDDRHKRIHRERRLTQHKDSEGAWKASLRGPIEAQAEFKAAHEPILDELFQAARANGEHEPRAAYAFDALIEMARRATGETPEPDAQKKRPPAKWIGILRLDLEALQRGWIEGDETCEIRGLGPIPVTKTKHTRLEELDPLCTHHHDLKTNRRWALIAGTGKRPMVAPHDPRHPNHGGPPRRE